MPAEAEPVAESHPQAAQTSCALSVSLASIYACTACNILGCLRAIVTGWSRHGKAAFWLGSELMAIPNEIRGQKYISLATFRKSGEAVYTPVWFGELGDKLYVKTRNDSGKSKRIRNNPKVKVAPCTMRGKIAGPEFPGTARALPPGQWGAAKQAVERKYWMARLAFWRRNNEYLEIEISA